MKKVICKILLAVLITASATVVKAQQSSILSGAPPLNGVYIPEHLGMRKPVPYTALREADVMWSKRIWRMIDLREKINHPLRYPEEKIQERQSLFHVIAEGLNSGQLHAYDALDDDFAVELTPSQIKTVLEPTKQILKQDLETGVMDTTVVPDPITSDKISKYYVKEDWFFDKQRSVMDVRIIGLAPMKKKKDENGEDRADENLFWLYFPECRPLFATREVFNRQNATERRTFDDIFAKRLFSSYIFKEENVYDRVITEYALGLNALLESERIKNDIFEIEHDLWHF